MLAEQTSERRAAELVPLILRLSLGIVFLVFGVWKATSPVDWLLFVPGWLAPMLDGISVIDTFGVLKMLGFVEAVLGIQLLGGLFTRLTATLCAVGLLAILFHIGLDQVGIRDLGLLGASAALIAAGGGQWSIDRWFLSQPGA